MKNFEKYIDEIADIMGTPSGDIPCVIPGACPEKCKCKDCFKRLALEEAKEGGEG